MIPFAVVGGRIASRRGHRPVLMMGGLLYALAQSWYFFRAGATPDYLGVWLPGQLVGGAAIGLVLPSLAGAAVAHLPPGLLAAGSAVNQAVRQLGLALGVTLAVNCVGRIGANIDDFKNVYALLALGGLATAALALPISTRPDKKNPAPSAKDDAGLGITDGANVGEFAEWLKRVG